MQTANGIGRQLAKCPNLMLFIKTNHKMRYFCIHKHTHTVTLTRTQIMQTKSICALSLRKNRQQKIPKKNQKKKQRKTQTISMSTRSKAKATLWTPCCPHRQSPSTPFHRTPFAVPPPRVPYSPVPHFPQFQFPCAVPTPATVSFAILPQRRQRRSQREAKKIVQTVAQMLREKGNINNNNK